MKHGLLLDVVVGQSATIFQLLPSKNKTLLVRTDALLILNPGLDIVGGVQGLNLQDDRLVHQGLHEDLHAAMEMEHEVEDELLLNIIVKKGMAVLKLLPSKDQALLVRRDAVGCETGSKNMNSMGLTTPCPESWP